MNLISIFPTRMTGFNIYRYNNLHTILCYVTNIAYIEPFNTAILESKEYAKYTV